MNYIERFLLIIINGFTLLAIITSLSVGISIMLNRFMSGNLTSVLMIVMLFLVGYLSEKSSIQVISRGKTNEK